MTSTTMQALRPTTIEPVAALAQPEPPAASLMTILHQLQAVVGCLHDDQYSMRPVGVVDSSIGGHVRHCLDHVRALLMAIDTGELDYDSRDRGTPIETDRSAALAAIKTLRNRLAGLDDETIDRPLALSVMMTSEGAAMRVTSSVGREMAYVLSHTIHHNALVGTMVKTLGGWLPDRFGYAPSTLAHLKASTCAQ
jgi:uncharacterized damage-inducible protein DinB